MFQNNKKTLFLINETPNVHNTADKTEKEKNNDNLTKKITKTQQGLPIKTPDAPNVLEQTKSTIKKQPLISSVSNKQIIPLFLLLLFSTYLLKENYEAQKYKKGHINTDWKKTIFHYGALCISLVCTGLLILNLE